MADVFISYARDDRKSAQTLAYALEACGWSVWWDSKIIPGQSWDAVIERELESAKSVVVLWSRHSVSREWVKNEAAVAAQRGVLVPALIERVEIPLEFRRKQTVDLSAWNGNPSEEVFNTLCQGIAANVQDKAIHQPAIRRSRASFHRRYWLTGGIVAIFIAVEGLWPIRHPDRPIDRNETVIDLGKSSNDSSKTPRDNKDTHADFEGTVDYMVQGKRFPPTSYHISLDITGIKVRGSYFDGQGDKGTLNGTIDGNSLDLIIASDRIPGACPLKASLMNEGSILQGIYQCLIDGEHGEFNLRRR